MNAQARVKRRLDALSDRRRDRCVPAPECTASSWVSSRALEAPPHRIRLHTDVVPVRMKLDMPALLDEPVTSRSRTSLTTGDRDREYARP